EVGLWGVGLEPVRGSDAGRRPLLVVRRHHQQIGGLPGGWQSQDQNPNGEGNVFHRTHAFSLLSVAGCKGNGCAGGLQKLEVIVFVGFERDSRCRGCRRAGAGFSRPLTSPALLSPRERREMEKAKARFFFSSFSLLSLGE